MVQNSATIIIFRNVAGRGDCQTAKMPLWVSELDRLPQYGVLVSHFSLMYLPKILFHSPFLFPLVHFYMLTLMGL